MEDFPCRFGRIRAFLFAAGRQYDGPQYGLIDADDDRGPYVPVSGAHLSGFGLYRCGIRCLIRAGISHRGGKAFRGEHCGDPDSENHLPPEITRYRFQTQTKTAKTGRQEISVNDPSSTVPWLGIKQARVFLMFINDLGVVLLDIACYNQLKKLSNQWVEGGLYG